MLSEEALAKLGLPADATPEAISAAVLQLGSAGSPTEPEPDPEGDEGEGGGEEPPAATSTLEIPDGMVLMDEATLNELRSGLVAATQLKQEKEKADRDALLTDAIKAGKIPPARRSHYEQLLCSDPVGTKQLLASLAPGLIPVVEQGSGLETDKDDEAFAYPDSWKRTVAAANRHASGSIIKAVND